MENEPVQTIPDAAPAPVIVEKLNFANLLSDMWELAKSKIWNLLGIYLVTTILSMLAMIAGLIIGGIVMLLLSFIEVPALMVIVGGIMLIALIGALIWITTWGMIASLKYIALPNDTTISIQDVFNETRPHVTAITIVLILGILAIIGGLIAFIIPGIIIYISLMFIVTVALFEQKTTWEALKRSRDLVRGRWWNIFLVNVAFWIIALFAMAASGMQYSPIVILFSPLYYVISYIMYKKLISLPPAKTPTTRGIWYYQAAAALAVGVIIIAIVGIAIGSGTDMEAFKGNWATTERDHGDDFDDSLMYD